MISKAYGKYIFDLIFGLPNQAIIILEKLIQKDKYSKKCLNSFNGVRSKGDCRTMKQKFLAS